MSRYTMKKHEALNYIADFEKYLKEKDDIKLKPRERACMKRFIHWLYDKEGWTISAI